MAQQVGVTDVRGATKYYWAESITMTDGFLRLEKEKYSPQPHVVYAPDQWINYEVTDRERF